MRTPLRVLIAEDSPDDAELLLLELSRGGFDPIWKRVETAQELRAALAEGSWEVVLSDHTMPGFGASVALAICREADPDLPFIVVSGTIGEEVAVKIMRAGANDYFLKGSLVLLPPAIERELREAGNRRARRRAENASLRLASIVAWSDDAIIGRTLDGLISDWNPAAERLFGWSAEEAIGKHISLILPAELGEELRTLMERVAQGERFESYETDRLRKDGTRINVAITISPIRDPEGQVIGVSTIARDITAKKRAEKTQSLLAAVVDSSEDPMVCADLEGRVQSWNPAAEKLFGYTAAEVLGLTGFLIPVDLMAEARDIDEHIRRGERVSPFETVRLRKGGQPVAVSITLSPVWVGGQVVAKSAVYRDITRQKEAEAQLREARAATEHHLVRLRTVIATMIEGVIVADAAGNMLDWNAAALHLHGFADVNEVRQPLAWFGPRFELHSPEGPLVPESDWPLARVLRGETFTGWELYLNRLDTGDKSVVNYSGAPVLGAAGEVQLAVLTLHDVTERKRAEQEMRLFRALIDKTSDGIEVIDPQTGRFLDANERTCVSHGYTREEFLNLSVPDIDPFIAADSWQTLIDQGWFSGPRLFEGWHARKDGSRFPVEVSHNSIFLDREYLVAVVRDITERRHAEAERNRLLSQLELQIERLPLAYLLSGPDFRYTRWNPAAERMFGFAEAQILGKHPFEVIVPPQSQAGVRETFERLQAGDMNAHGDCENVTRAGRLISCQWYNTPLLDQDGNFLGLLSLAQDITQQVQLENQFRQAQKMEAFGQLAGGVAHDFNNLLTIINGYSDLLIETLQPGDSIRGFLNEIRNAGERSASLTRQLLAFSRKQVVAPKILDLNAVVVDTEKLLRRLIGEDVQLTTTLAGGLGSVRADEGQIQQVLLNLAVNARDAMPQGGRLTIETGNIDLDESYGQSHTGVLPGPYVQLAVSDTGCGMTAEIKARLFEPFFTTKAVGKGTGLGLAVVHGVIRQAGGHVEVFSELGIGTTFKVYLPRLDQPARLAKSQPGITTLPRGTETVLLAEDDEAVRSLTRHMLKDFGYLVLEASSGDAGLRIAEKHAGPIHLLITDVIMPTMSGRQVAEALVALHPEAHVLFVSGYTDDAVVRHGILQEKVHFLPKPFSPMALATKIREVLDASH